FVERPNLSAPPTPALTLTVAVWVWLRDAMTDDAPAPTTAATTASATMKRRTDIKPPPKKEDETDSVRGTKYQPSASLLSANPSSGTTIVKTNAARPTATSSGRDRCSRPSRTSAASRGPRT